MSFFILTPSRGKGFPSEQGGRDYVFWSEMVLVAYDCGCAHHHYPAQGKVYEMVEQTGTRKEKRSAWKMGGR